MKLNLITLDTVKAQLGITDNTYDTQITGMIPLVSADVRRILNCQYDRLIRSIYKDTESTFVIHDPFDTETYHPILIDIGTVMSGTDVPEDIYITAYDQLSGEYTLSGAFTGDGGYLTPTVNIAQWSTISKMVFYKIEGQTTDDVDSEVVASESIGVVKVTYGSGVVNKRWNYPQTLIDDLGVPFAEVG